MPNILVRGVSGEVHATLQRRAQQRGQSLQQFVLLELQRLAAQPSPEDVFARIRSRSGGRVGLEQAVQDLRSDRER